MTVGALWLFLIVPLVGLQCEIVVFPDHMLIILQIFSHYASGLLQPTEYQLSPPTLMIANRWHYDDNNSFLFNIYTITWESYLDTIIAQDFILSVSI